MCSVSDEFDAAEAKYFSTPDAIKLGDHCIKCRIKTSTIILKGKDSYCNDCFITGTVHKFKSALGKHKHIRPGDKVLVAYNGSPAATTLLHLIRTGLELSTPKRLKFESRVVFIETEYRKDALRSQSTTLSALKEAVHNLGFQLRFVSLEDYIKDPSSMKLYDNLTLYLERPPPTQKRIIDSKVSGTNLTALYDIMHNEILTKSAKHLDCKFCFTHELSIDTAINILSSITLGRGIHTPLDVGFRDDRYEEAIILRPMRNLELDEVIFYNKLNNLIPIDLSCYTFDKREDASVQNMIRSFTTNLLNQYPNSINTIVRTGDKLAYCVSDNFTRSEKICRLCRCGISDQKSELHSAEATILSKNMSTTNIDFTMTSSLVPQTEHGISDPTLCYSCKNMGKCLIDL